MKNNNNNSSELLLKKQKFTDEEIRQMIKDLKIKFRGLKEPSMIVINDFTKQFTALEAQMTKKKVTTVTIKLTPEEKKSFKQIIAEAQKPAEKEIKKEQLRQEEDIDNAAVFFSELKKFIKLSQRGILSINYVRSVLNFTKEKPISEDSRYYSEFKKYRDILKKALAEATSRHLRFIPLTVSEDTQKMIHHIVETIKFEKLSDAKKEDIKLKAKNEAHSTMVDFYDKKLYDPSRGGMVMEESRAREIAIKEACKMDPNFDETTLEGIIASIAAGAAAGTAATIVSNIIKKINKKERLALGDVIPSAEVKAAEIQSIGFDGDMLTLFGDPSNGFTALIWGEPKGGKSTMGLNFAKYLAKKFGKTLFITVEEGTTSPSFIKKVKDWDIEHPDLVFADAIPKDLSGYRFVFIDTISKLGLEADDITKLKKKYPDTNFFFIAQSRKDGDFRGGETIKHEVDTVVKIKDGIAVGYGRFNAAGSIKIFPEKEDKENEQVSGLDGTPGGRIEKSSKITEDETETGDTHKFNGKPEKFKINDVFYEKINGNWYAGENDFPCNISGTERQIVPLGFVNNEIEQLSY